MTRLVRPAPATLIVALVLAMFLAGAMSLLPAGPAHAQGVLPTITVEAGETGVPVDATALFRLNRSGDLSGDLSVRLETLNTRGRINFGSGNPTLIIQFVRMPPNVTQVDVRVWAQRGNRLLGEMQAQVLDGSGYQQGDGTTNRASVAVREPTDDDTIVSLEAVEGSIAEGDDAEFTVSRSGSTASSLTVRVETEDLDGAMQGNHWDPAPADAERLKSATIPAGQSSATVSFPTRPNVRDTGDLTLMASMVDDEDSTYWVSYNFRAGVTVTDDDTAMEVSLSVDRDNILEGESITFTFTRHGDASEALENAPFHLRIGPNIRRYLWPEYEEPQDYAVTMAAGESARDLSFKVHYDRYYWRLGDTHRRNFRFRAEIRPASGIPEEHLNEYVSVRGDRRVEAIVTNQAKQTVTFVSVGSGFEGEDYDNGRYLSELFFEGQRVPFVMERSGPAAQIAKELAVHVKYVEPYHPDRRGYLLTPSYYNPSQQSIFVTFAAGQTRANGEFFVAVDDVVEGVGIGRDNFLFLWASNVPLGDYYSDYSGYSIVGRIFTGRFVYAYIGERSLVSIAAVDDSPTIDFGEDPGSDLPSTGVTIEEGEDAEFVLTRTGLKDYEITVSVSIDDHGHFRRGDHWRNTPDRTAPVTFAAGEDTAYLTVHTSDDGRDIPDNTLTATVLPSQDDSYTPVEAGERRTSATVTVTDNDVAPEIRLSVSSSTVEEGQEAYFDIVRSGDSQDYRDFPLLFGLQGEQAFRVYTLGPGEDLARRFLRTEDDDHDDPDETVYEMTLLPLEGVPDDEQSQYRTIVGPSSITITVTDNDLPMVGVEQIEESYVEGELGQLRIVRVGQTGSPLNVKARVTQTGNSYFERYQDLLNVARTYTIDASEDSEVSSFQLQWEDGHEPEGSMTMQLVPGDGYRIDPERSIASFRVIEDDPAPTLAVTGATVSEDAGKIRFRVSLSSSVSPPSLQTVTVDYVTEDGTAEAGEDYTHIAGTLVIGPEKTSGVIDVPVLDNRLTEETESFSLVLSDPVNAELQDDQAELTAVATITDNEPHVTVAPVEAEVDEGSPIRFRFTRSGDNIDLSGPLTVYFLAGYEDLPPEWLEVVITADRSSVTWQKTTEDDDYDGPDLTFLVLVIPSTWWGLPLDYSSVSTSVRTVVRDNDLPVVTIEAVHEGRTEGDSVEFTLSREGQLHQPLTVNVSVAQTSDSETEQADFIKGTPPATATFAADTATATLTVPTSLDSATEPHATITASITDEEDDGYRAGDPGSASVRMIDDDRDYTTSLSISAQAGVVEEGDAAVFVVRRTDGTNLDLVARVRVTEIQRVPGSAPTDHNPLVYSVTEREVSFNPGDVTTTLEVSTEDENVNDGNSRIKASLLPGRFYGINPYPSIANIWVRDNDIPTVSFAVAHIDHVETPGQFPQFTLVRTGDASYRLDVHVVRGFVLRYGLPYEDKEVQSNVHFLPIIVGESETTYTAEPGLVGPRGAQSTVTIEQFYCEEVPGDCGYNGQYRVGEISTFTATIHNSDQGVIVEAERESVNEGESVTFTLTRVGGTPESRDLPLTVQVAVTQDGEFIQGVTPQTVRFAGDTSVAGLGRPTAAVTIETHDDDVYESDGSITLTILPPAEQTIFLYYEVGDGGGLQNTMATVAVVSDDDPAVSIADAEASEAGGSIEFTVTAPAVHEEVTVDWATSDGAGSESATADQDYTAATGTLRFLEGETSKTISIEILDDGVPEPDETFTVTLSNPAGVALGRAAATGTIRDDDPETLPVVTLWTRHGNVEEGDLATFSFRRQPAGGGPVSEHDGFGASPLTLNLTLTESGDFIEEALENYAGVKIEYTPGSNTATVTIPATHLYFFAEFSTDDDGQTEDNGSITLALAEGPGYTIGEENEATVNVRDNDLSISIADPERHSEDATGMGFTITLSKASDQQVSVDVTTVDGTATSDDAVTAASLGKDFEARRGTFTFAPGETEKVFTVTLVDDTFDEGEESFTVELSNPSGNVSLQDASATGTISDNDMTMIVGVYREARIVNEDAESQVEFRFELTAAEGSGTTASEKMSTVRWTVAEGAATAGEDYEAVEDSVRTQIEPGVLSKKVGVTLLDDEVYEDEYETFTFDLKGAVRLEVDEDNQSIEISLRDNETMRAVVAADSENVAEGGTASFTVSLMPHENAVPVEIEYAVVGTAGPADYTAPSGTLTIRAGETSGRVVIPVLMDPLHDPDETLGILLTRVAGGGREIALLTDTLATVTILDAGSLSASLASGASAAEGDGIEFTIELPLPTDMPVLVEWATSDAQGEQAADSMGVDYTDASGTVTIPAGDTSGTFTVSTVEDILVEGDETFTVVLRSAKKGDDPATSTDVTMAIRSVTATILDDDTAPASITLTATPDRVDEDAGETDLAVTATLDGSTRLEDDVSVELSLKGSVAAQEDGSQPASVILTIPAGQASGTATVAMTPANDEIAGGDTRVRIAGSASGFDVTRATVSITDDDEPPTGVILTVSKASVSEGAGTTTITVTGTLTGGDRLSGDTTIPLSVHGISLPAAEENGEPTIAATNDDYTAAGVMLAIPAGGATGTATLEFTPTDDNLVEGDETVQVSGIFQELQVTPATLTIEDDDRGPDGIELSATPGGVTEDDGEVQVQVTATLTGGGTRTSATAVTLSVYDVSAMAGADYTAASGILLIIPAGQVSGMASLSVTLVDDDIYEGTETVAIRGSNEDPGLSVRGVRISIADDEEKPTEIRLVLDRDTIAEGGGSQQLRVTAIVQGDSKRAVSTRISLSFGAPTTESSAGPSTPRSSTRSSTTRSSTRSSETGPSAVPPAAATDYSALVNTLMIPAGESGGEVVVLVSPIDDPIAEGDESLEIRGSTPGLKVSSALVTITDNDVAGVTVSPTALDIREGENDSYTVVLDTQPSGNVTIEVAVPKDSEVSVEPALLTFTTSDWDDAQTVTVTAKQDDDAAAEDEITLSHTVDGADYNNEDAADVTVSVTDDETASIVLSASSLTVVEDATGGTYTVKLSHEPSVEVTVTVTGQDQTDLTLSGLSGTDTLTFSTTSWDDAQTVTVKAGEDADAKNDKVTLVHTGAGGEYEGASSDLAVTVDDDETVSVVLSKTTLTVEEEDATGGTYTVKLSHEPSEEVTVTVTGHDQTDLTLSGLSGTDTLTFSTTSWDDAQTVTVKAGEDADAKNDKVTLVHTGAGGEYEGASSDLAVTVDDDETVSVVLSKTTLTVEEEDATGGTYTVKLSHEPSVEVTVTVTGQDQTDLTLSGLSGTDTLTFSTTSWDDAQTVTVKAGEDADAKNDKVTLVHTGAGGEYEGASSDLAVTVDDDETVSIVLSKTDLTVEEEDATGGTYTVKLSHEPSVEVTVTVTGQDQTDLTLSGLSGTDTLTFSTTSWDDAQTVTVKAGEDADAKNDKVTLVHTGAGGEYEGASSDLAVTVDDDETVSIVLSKTDLTVEEEDATGGTYTVKLSHEPSVEVTVTVTGQDQTDLTLSGLSGTDTLTFSTTSWDDAQTVTVKAGEDADAKNDKVTLVHTGAGGEYEGVAEDLAVTVDDDETLDVVISPTALTVQAGGSNSYTVVLGSLPSGDVTVTLSGHEGSVLSLAGIDNDNALTFTQDNWHAPQTVSVSADAEAQSSTITIEHSVASADDPDYAAAAAPDVAVSVLGATDTIQIQVGVATSVQELEVPEGGANTYSMVLSHQPSGDVTVTVNNPTDNSEVTATPRTLTFTTENWHAPQTVTVAAVHDGDAADDSATVTHGVADGGYNGVTVPDVAVTVDDDETVSIVLSKTDLTVVEDATGGTYTVKLSHEPSVEVTVTVTGQDQTDLTLSGLSGTDTLTFSTTSWDDAQTVTVKAGEDADAKNDKVTLVHTGAGGEYEGASSDLAVTVDDDETVSVVLSKTTLTVEEEDATGGTYTVKLSHEPSEEVTVTVTGHDQTDLTLSGLSGTDTLTFSTTSWDDAQTVTVKAGEDADAKNDKVTLVHTGAGGEYEGASSDLAVTVDDDETVSVVLSKTTLTVEEEDATGGTYTVKLSHEPSVEVTVTVTGQDQTDLTLSGLSGTDTLTFSTTSWDDAQTVTVKAGEDADAKNDKVTLVHTGAGGEYEGASSDLAVTVDDDETVSIVLSKTDLTVEEEDATGGTYTVKLSHEPSVEVTVTVTGQDQTDLTLSGLSGTDTLTFSTTSWDDAQTVTVKAGEDADAKNDKVTLVHTGAGGEYEGASSDLAVTVDDDETVSIVLSKTDLTVEEEDATGGTYTVKLSHEPSVEVTVTVTGQDQTDLTLSGLSGTDTLTFSTTSWDDAQTVTVKAGEDADAKNDKVTLVHTGAGGEYEGVAEDLAVTVDDDETLDVVISPTALTVQAGGSNSYTVVLGSLPSGDVTVTLSGHEGSVLSLAGIDNDNALTFTQDNWHAPQTVSVSADAEAQSSTITIEHSVASADDPDYAAAAAPDVAVSVLGATDTIQIQVGVATSVQELEVPEGGANTYSMVLSHQPSGDVTVTVNNPTDNSEVTATPRTLTFTTENWHAPQTVTVAAVHDGDAADDSATVTHGVADGGYNGVTVPDVAVTVDDDETVSIVLSKTDLTVVEDATGGTYTVKLSHEPSVEVTVTVTGQDQTDLTLSGLSGTDTLTFSTTSWDDAQTVTVKAGEDADAKNDKVTLVHTGAGGEYEGVAEDLAVTVDDDETVSIVLSKTTLTVEEEDATGGTYTVKLSHEPSVEVTVTVTGQDQTDLTLSGLSGTDTLTFSTTSWDDAQTVTVKAGEDADAKNDKVTLVHTGAGGEYEGASSDLAVTVDDDETVSVVLSKTTLTVEEEDATGGTYTVKLSHEPSEEVTVTVTGQDQTDLTLSGLSGTDTLTFSTTSWDDAQTVTVKAGEDADAKNDKVTLVHTGAGGEYEGASSDLAVTVDDDETVSVVLSKTTLTVEEEDATGGTYTVKLSHEPSVEVTVTVTGQDQTDLTLSGLSGTDTLTFSTTSWDDAQTVTVKAGEDADAKNDKVTLVHTGAGGEYEGASSDLAVTVDDDETVSIVLSKTDLTVEEEDATGGTYTVKLSHEPSVEVTVTVTGQDQTDLTLSGLSGTDTLTFSTTSWDDAQTVTVKAGEDADAKNDKVTLVHTGAGGEYEGASSDLAVTVDDDETVSIVLSKTDLTVEEEDATGGTYTVKLSHEPSVEVTVTVTGQDQTDLTLSGLSGTDTLTFSTTSWDDAQTVTVKAGEDADAKNDKVTLVHTGAGGEYEGVAEDLAVTVDDDETLDVVISPTALTVQAGGSNSYTVVLGSLPSGDVTVTLSGHEGSVLSLAGIDNDNALTFTQDNWHAPQTVSVSADAEAQSSTITIEHSVASADDPDYAAAAAPDVAVSVLGATDTIQIQVGVATSVQELEVPEGGANTYSMVLSHQPSGDVTVTVNNPTDNSEVTATPRTLTFTTENWHAPQTVTVAAVHDGDAADDSATVTHGVADGGYNGVTVPDVAVTVDDDETVSIVLSKTDLTVEEEDATGGTYTVKLSHEPSVEVTVTVTGQDQTDLTLSGLSGTDTLTFSTTSWDDAQTVTVKAGEDADAKNDKVTLVHTGAGGEYEGVAEDLAVTVDDDETLDVVISPTALTVQAGGSNSYTVVLGSLPSGDVTVTLSGHEGSVLSLAGIDNDNALTFTQDNWHAPQTVSVSADAEAQSSTITIEHSVASADDPDYAAAAAPDVAVSVLGATDTIQIQVGVATSVQELEVPEGGANTYSMVLSHQPSGDVTVTVNNPTDNSEVTATPRTLTFTTENWHAPQTVTVAAVHDGDAADDSATVTHGVADGGYNGVTVPDVAVTVDDDETVSIVLSKTDLTVEEEDATGGTYTVKLSHEPSVEVTVTVTGQDQTDLTLSGLSGTDTLTFSTTSWDDAQTVTVKAGEDADAKNDKVTLVHTGAGGEYEGVAEDLAVTVDDDETLDVVISPTALTVQAGGSNSYTVVLGSLPSGDVTVTLSGHEGSVLSLAGIDNDNALTFTQDNWHAPQTVSVSADAEAQSSTITIEHSVASADDPDYAAAAAPDVAVSVLGATDTIQIQVGVATSVQELEVPEGGANTYSMVLSHQPSGDVTVTVNNPTDNSEVTATPRTLTFTTENWHAPQTVTVAAVHDGDAADDSATVTHGVADGGYNGVTVPDVAVTVDDDETVSIVLSKTDLTVVEDATGGTYTVKLSHEPSVEVTVTVTGQDQTDLTLSGLSGTDTLTFSTTSWDDAQTVTVKAGEDADAKNDKVTLVHTGAGGEYEGASSDLAVTVDDDETVSIVLSKTDLTVEEEDATGGTYTVKLSHEPSEEVTVTVSGHDQTDLELTGLGEGDTLTFTTSTWDDAQTVTVKAGEDADAANDKVTLVHTAAGGEYEGVAEDLAVTVDDDENINEAPLLESVKVRFNTAAHAILEGDTTTVVVSLSDALEQNVTISLTRTNQAGASDADYSGVPASLAFDSGVTEQSFTISATVDSEDDDEEQVVLGFGTLPEGVTQGTVSQATITIQDVPSVSFGASDYSATEGGEDALVTVRLSEVLAADVTVPLTAEGDGGATPEDWSGVPEEVTFSAGETSKTFTVVAFDDAVEDDDEMVHLGFGTLPNGLNAAPPASATVTLMNVEEPSSLDPCVDVWCTGTVILKWAAGHPTIETAPILSCAPTCPGSSITGGRLIADGVEYRIASVAAIRDIRPTKHNWSRFRFSISARDTVTGQTISLTERQIRSWTLYINDDIQLPLSSAAQRIGPGDLVWFGETFYQFVEDTVLEMRIETNDDDTVSIVLSSTTPVDEGSNYGGTYTVKLSHQPSEEVTVTVSGQDGTDLTLTGLSSANTLTFDATSWDDAQTLTVKADQDTDAANDKVTLTHTAAGGEYAGVSANLAVTVYDDDKAFLVLGEPSLAVDEGDAAGQTYTVKLSHEPSEEVTVTVSGHEGSDLTLTGLSATNELTFTTESWHTAQTVTVTAGQDSDAADDVVTLTHTASGGEYAGVMSDMAVRVDDDEDVGNAPEEVGNAPIENTAATGRPVIGGTPAVGETLTADTSDIEDVNGLTNASFAFQWARNDGSLSADITGATGATYTVTEADVGYEIEVRVSFTDDADFEETVTSYTVYVQPPQPLYGGLKDGPVSHDGSTAFMLELYFSEDISIGYEAVRDDVLDVTGGSVTNVRRLDPNGDNPNMRWEITVEPSGNDEVTLVLPITTDCDDQGAVCTSSEKMLSNKSSVTIAGPPETAQQVQPENSPATSAPTVTGTARVGETLTADTSGIADADGLTNATFTYQWVAGGSDISGATGSTYTLTASDQGQTVQVRVSFTDDAGNEETLTSEVTAAVAAAPAPLTVSLTVAAPTTHDGSSSFTFEIRFSEEPESDFSYKTLRNHGFTVTGGTVRNAERMDRPSNMRWLITVEPDSNGDVTIVLPITEDCGEQGAICTDDDRKLSNRLEFTVSGSS